MHLDPKVITAITAREKGLLNDRTGFENTWQEIQENILPWHGRNLRGGSGGTGSKEEDQDGRLKGHRILDGTATRALHVTSAGMQAGINSPARPWFKLGYADKDLTEYKPVRVWLDQVERIIRDIYSRSNIYNMLHHSYTELAGFGNAAAFIQPDFDTIAWARPMTIGEYWIALNDRGIVDTFMRKFRLSAKQMVTKFGIDNVSNAVKSAYEKNNTEATFEVTLFIEPNDGRVNFPFSQNFPFRMVYHEKSFEMGKALMVAGRTMFPVLAPRWQTVGMMAYGFGPGDATLSDVKGLQKEYEKKLVAEAKMVDPPLKGPSGLVNEIVNTMPGGITIDDSMPATNGITPLYEVRYDINAALTGIQDTRMAIRQGLFTDLFTLIANSVDVAKTATEVAALKEEKMMVLGPVLDSVHTEIHSPLLDITFRYAQEAGILPEPPEEVEGRELDVEFISILAQAQKMIATSGIEQLAGFVGNISAVFPEATKKFNAVQAVDEYAGALGTSAELINSDQEVEAMIAAEQAQAQAAQAMEAAQMGADSAKVLSETDLGGNTALSALTAGMPGAPV